MFYFSQKDDMARIIGKLCHLKNRLTDKWLNLLDVHLDLKSLIGDNTKKYDN